MQVSILEINEKSINSDQAEVDQELQLLQDLRLQEWYQGDLQGYSKKEIKETIVKELVGHWTLLRCSQGVQLRMIRANRFARIALRISRATKF